MEKLKCKMAITINLYQIIKKMLFNYSDNHTEENKLPFNVKYKLQRAGVIFEQDYLLYESKRQELVKKYGTENDKGVSVVGDDKKEEFENELKEFLNTDVEHSIIKFTPNELEGIEVDISMSELEIFVSSLVDDPDFVNETK